MILTKKQRHKLDKCYAVLADVLSDTELIENCLSVGQARLDNPAVVFRNAKEDGVFSYVPDEEYADAALEVEQQGRLFNGLPYIDTDYGALMSSLVSNIPVVMQLILQLRKPDKIVKKFGEFHVQSYIQDCMDDKLVMDGIFADACRECYDACVLQSAESEPEVEPKTETMNAASVDDNVDLPSDNSSN